MKITIDTVAKTVKVEEDKVNLKDLFDFLEGMEIDIKEYSLLPVERKIEYIPYHYHYDDPWRVKPWWESPYTVICKTEGTTEINGQIFNYTLTH